MDARRRGSEQHRASGHYQARDHDPIQQPTRDSGRHASSMPAGSVAGCVRILGEVRATRLALGTDLARRNLAECAVAGATRRMPMG